MLRKKVLNSIKNLIFLLIAIKFVRVTTKLYIPNSYQKYLKVTTDLIDDFYHPCEDFYQHACGNYNNTVAPIAPFMYNKEELVMFFENTRANFTTTGGILLNVLYESCKQKNWDLSQWKSIDFLEEFAKWPFLHYQWQNSEINVTWPNLMAQLAARGIPVFFEVFFAKNTVFVSPVDVRCPAEQDAITELIMSPATSVLNKQVADIISSELWSFCKSLTQEYEISSEKPERIGIQKERLEFFEVFFKALNISSDEILASREIGIRIERLEQMLRIAHDTDPRIVINFIIWKMLEALEYTDCFPLTEEFDPLFLSEYWNWDVMESVLSKDVALASYLYHTTRFQRRRQDYIYAKDWESLLDKKHRRRRKDLNLGRIIKTYGNNNLSPEIFESDYSELELRKDTFYQNYFMMKKQQLRLAFLKDNYVDKEDFNHPANLVRRFLNFVILLGKQPLFHYFASEGFNLWYNSEFLYSTDDLYTTIDCLTQQTPMYSDESIIFSNLTVIEMEELFKFNRAFYESLYDYLFWLEGEMFFFAEDYVLENFNLNSSQVLFYAVTQLYCDRDNFKYPTLINRSFMNTWEFRDAFECDNDEPMNPQEKCM